MEAITDRTDLPTCLATLSLEETQARTWDVLIAGAGPAGSVAARELARRGASVLLVDKAPFPRWKVCGCSLNLAALQTLAAVGLENMPQRLGAVPLAKLHLRVGAVQAELALPGGAALSREAFDAALVAEAIRAGVQFLPETEAVLQAKIEDCRRVELRHDSECRVVGTRVAIAADGLAGRFLKDLPEMAPLVAPQAPIGAAAMIDHAPEDYRPGIIYMASGAGGYVGALRIEDGRLAVAAALQAQRLRASHSPAALAEEIFTACRFPQPEMLRQAVWRGTPSLTRRRCVAAERLFVIGDSAAYLQPFTGEGISWAVQSAVLVGPAALESVTGWRPGLAEQWKEQHRQFLARRQRVCQTVGVLLRHPLLARTAVTILSWTPWLAAPWVSRVNTASRGVLAWPGAY